MVKGCKGHLPEQLHLNLLTQLQAILPENYQAIFLGDGEFDGVQLQEALQSLDLDYVCRTAKISGIVQAIRAPYQKLISVRTSRVPIDELGVTCRIIMYSI